MLAFECCEKYKYLVLATAAKTIEYSEKDQLFDITVS